MGDRLYTYRPGELVDRTFARFEGSGATPFYSGQVIGGYSNGARLFLIYRVTHTGQSGDLGVDLFPKADPATVNVRLQLPGASPDEMTTSVVMPMENALSGIAGIDQLQANVQAGGNANITVRFVLERNLDDAANDVRDRISRVRGRLSKSSSTICCHAPMHRRPRSNGMEIDGPNIAARTWLDPLSSPHRR